MTARMVLLNVVATVAYAVVYVAAYVYFLNFFFDYMGYGLQSRDASFYVQSLLIAVAPVACYRGCQAISSFIAVAVYLLLYIPVILTFALGSELTTAQITGVQLVFMGSMVLLFLADAVLVRSPVLGSDLNLIMPALVLTILGTLYMLVVYRGNLRLVSFVDVYAQRVANEVVSGNIVTRYVSSWLGSVLVPICLAYGLVGRKPWYVITGTVACLTFYMATAGKIMILLPAVSVGLWVMLSRNRVHWLYPSIAGGLSALIAGLLTVTKQVGGLSFLASAILIQRTIGNGGQLMMAYHEFFSFYPQTDYSHVMGIRLLTHPYPYGSDGLGQVIGKFYGNAEVNLNASFWATDGIAAMGLAGVVVMSVVATALFVLINAVTRGYDRGFVVICFASFIMTLLNSSLFSSVWSGGGLFLILFFLVNRRSPLIVESQVPVTRGA